MRMDEKFNLRPGKAPVEVIATVSGGLGISALGVRVSFFIAAGIDHRHQQRLHLTPDEAVILAGDLLMAARDARR